MLNPKKDLYSRLVISAQKDRFQNLPFKKTNALTVEDKKDTLPANIQKKSLDNKTSEKINLDKKRIGNVISDPKISVEISKKQEISKPLISKQAVEKNSSKENILLNAEKNMERNIEKTSGNTQVNISIISSDNKSVDVATVKYPIKTIQKNKSKIEEKINQIVENPKILEIRREIENAERIITVLKKNNKKDPKIISVEKKLLTLKELLEQKIYI